MLHPITSCYVQKPRNIQSHPVTSNYILLRQKSVVRHPITHNTFPFPGEVRTLRPLDREESVGYWLRVTVLAAADSLPAATDNCWVSTLTAAGRSMSVASDNDWLSSLPWHRWQPASCCWQLLDESTQLPEIGIAEKCWVNTMKTAFNNQPTSADN